MFLDQQILEWLVSKKKLSGKQAGQLMAASGGRSLELILVERGMLDKASLLEIKSRLCDLRPVDLDAVAHIDLNIVRMLPSSMSRKFNAVVYGVEEERLLVALANPTDPFARYFISMRTNRDIDTRVAYLGDVQSLQDRAYPSEEPEVITQGLLVAPASPRLQGVTEEASHVSNSRRVGLPQEQAAAAVVPSTAYSLTRTHRPEPAVAAPPPDQAPTPEKPPAKLLAAAVTEPLAGARPAEPPPSPERAEIKPPETKVEAPPPQFVPDPAAAEHKRKARESGMLALESARETNKLTPAPAAPPPKPSPAPLSKPVPEPVMDKPHRPERRSLELPPVRRNSGGLTVDNVVAASARLQDAPAAAEAEIEVEWEDDGTPPPPVKIVATASRPAATVTTGVSLLDSLSVMSINLAESGRLTYVVPQVLHTARVLTGAQAAAFLMCEPDRKYISYYATDGGGADASQYAVPFDETTVPGWCVIRGEALTLASLRSDPRFSTSAEQAVGLPTGGTICVPVRWGPDILGALVACTHQDQTLDIRPLHMVAAPLGAAVRARHMETSIHDIRMETVEALLDWSDAGMPGSRQHGTEVAQLATAIARTLALPPSDIDELCIAALLHDVGLLPDRERDRPEHPQRAGQILQKVRILQKMIPLVRYHHERYDGKGYPHGLKGESIPLAARVLAVAEAYCEAGLAKVPRTSPQLMAFLERFGTEFDPTMKAAFIRAANVGR